MATRDKFFKKVKIRRDKGLGIFKPLLKVLLSLVCRFKTLSQNSIISSKVKSELESEFEKLKSELEFFALRLSQN